MTDDTFAGGSDHYYCHGCNMYVTRYGHDPNCKNPDVARYRNGQEVERLGAVGAPILTDHYVTDS